MPKEVRETPAKSSVPVTALVGLWYAPGHNLSYLLLPVFIGKVGASSPLLHIPCELVVEASLRGICLH